MSNQKCVAATLRKCHLKYLGQLFGAGGKPFGIPTTHVRVRGFKSWLSFGFRLSINAHSASQPVQILWFLIYVKTHIESTHPSFSMAQLWLLWAFVQWTNKQKDLYPLPFSSLSLLSCLSLSFSTSFFILFYIKWKQKFEENISRHWVYFSHFYHRYYTFLLAETWMLPWNTRIKLQDRKRRPQSYPRLLTS